MLQPNNKKMKKLIMAPRKKKKKWRMMDRYRRRKWMRVSSKATTMELMKTLISIENIKLIALNIITN